VNSLVLSLLLFFAVLCIVGVGAVRSRPRTRVKAIIYLIGAVLFFGGALNFLIYWHVAGSLGGNALNGKIENGKYFLASHGRLTEVSPAVWKYSEAHARSISITHLLGTLGLLLMFMTGADRKKPSNQ